jgi:hypothetical protein
LGDAEAWYDLFTDLGIMHALGKEPVSTLEQAHVMTEDGIAGWRTGGLGPFVLETASANGRERRTWALFGDCPCSGVGERPPCCQPGDP